MAKSLPAVPLALLASVLLVAGCAAGASASAVSDASVAVEAASPPGASASASPPPSEGGPPDHGDGGAPSPDDGGGPEFSPYFPAWTFGAKGYAYTSLTNLQQISGVADVTLAFVLASPDGGCASDLATDGIGANLSDIHAFVAAGGHAKLSFGGAQGLYLQDPSACAAASALQSAIGSALDTTGIDDLDFDVEQPFTSGMSDQANENLGEALAGLQQTRDIHFSLTLQVNTDIEAEGGAMGPGLEGEAQILVKEVAAAGARIGRVNLMVMSFGPARAAGETEAQAAIDALEGAHAQVQALIPGLTSEGAWAMLGATAEIGQNDQNVGEIFTPADATTLATFARAQGMGLVSFWSIDRDRVCSGPCGFQKYSTVNTSNFEFAKAFLAAIR